MNALGCQTPDGVDDFQAFETIDNLFGTEAETTVRYLLSGRRCVRVRVCDFGPVCFRKCEPYLLPVLA